MDLRDAYFDALALEASKNRNIVFLTNDFEVFSLKKFKKDFPERHINVGVAEQNMINMAAGLAWAGKRPVVFGMCNFVTLRCFEQIKLQVACMNLPVTIVGVGPGFSFNFDGPSHHAISDMSLIATLPEMAVWNPSDPVTAAYLARNTLSLPSPSYVRIDKGDFPDYADSCPGGFYREEGYTILRNPNLRPTLITTGYMTERCMSIAKELNLGLISVSRIKPFPKELGDILRLAGHPIVVDDSGRGSPLAFEVADAFAGDNVCWSAFSLLSLEDRHTFDFGNQEFLLSKHGLDVKALQNRLYEACPWH